MADVFSKKKRSWVMSRIKSKNTKLELDFIKLLSSRAYPAGFRYRKHYPRLPGKPDIAFTKQKVVVFLDGDFWHGYNLDQLKKRPISKYWIDKIQKNILRDKKYNSELRKSGWTVLRFWEHEVKQDHCGTINKIMFSLNRGENQAEN